MQYDRADFPSREKEILLVLELSRLPTKVPRYHPDRIFLSGEMGLGKAHLIHIIHTMREKSTEESVMVKEIDHQLPRFPRRRRPALADDVRLRQCSLGDAVQRTPNDHSTHVHFDHSKYREVSRISLSPSFFEAWNGEGSSLLWFSGYPHGTEPPSQVQHRADHGNPAILHVADRANEQKLCAHSDLFDIKEHDRPMRSIGVTSDSEVTDVMNLDGVQTHRGHQRMGITFSQELTIETYIIPYTHTPRCQRFTLMRDTRIHGELTVSPRQASQVVKGKSRGIPRRAYRRTVFPNTAVAFRVGSVCGTTFSRIRNHHKHGVESCWVAANLVAHNPRWRASRHSSADGFW